MINAARIEPSTKRSFWGFWGSWGQPSETSTHYCNVLLAIVGFFIAQLLTCAWDLPFWAAGLDFPGQIVAMISVWVIMWACQILFFKPGGGLEWFYHRYLRAPVSLEHLSSRTCIRSCY